MGAIYHVGLSDSLTSYTAVHDFNRAVVLCLCWHVAQIVICRYTYADPTRRCQRPAAKTIAENGDCKQSVLSFSSYWNESLNDTKPTPIQSIWQNCRLRKKTVSRRSIVPYDSKLTHPKILTFGLLGYFCRQSWPYSGWMVNIKSLWILGTGRKIHSLKAFTEYGKAPWPWQKNVENNNIAKPWCVAWYFQCLGGKYPLHKQIWAATACACRRRESHTQLQPNDFWIGTLSVIPINKVRVCGIIYRLFFCVERSG